MLEHSQVDTQKHTRTHIHTTTRTWVDRRKHYMHTTLFVDPEETTNDVGMSTSSQMEHLGQMATCCFRYRGLPFHHLTIATQKHLQCITQRLALRQSLSLAKTVIHFLLQT